MTSENMLLYRADEIRLGDMIVGLGSVNRIERYLGEIWLHWGPGIGGVQRLGPDTEILAWRRNLGPVTVTQQSQARGVA